MSYNKTYYKNWYINWIKENREKRRESQKRLYKKNHLGYKISHCKKCGVAFELTMGKGRKLYCGNDKDKFSCTYKMKQKHWSEWLKRNPEYNRQRTKNYAIRKNGAGGTYSSDDWKKS